MEKKHTAGKQETQDTLNRIFSQVVKDAPAENFDSTDTEPPADTPRVDSVELHVIEKPTEEQKKTMAKKRTLAKKQQKIRNGKKALLGILLVVAVVLGGFAYAEYTPSKVDGQVIITIPEGAGTSTIAQVLKRENLISSPTFFRIMSKLQGIDGKYNFGKFRLNRNGGYKEIFHALCMSGQVTDTVKVTIPEGYEIYKIADTLEEKGLIDKNKFYELVNHGAFDYDFINEISQRDNRLEGYLFPSTYEFVPGDEYGIINEMLAQFQKMYTPYQQRAAEMGMSTDQVVTLASIIEREAIGDADRNLVSSVFHNRLKSDDYPYLQSCATVQYVLKERKPVLSIEDTKIDSPYNTYINKGLPIGPIASPGEKAISAALYPEDSDYLFFVLGSDGQHHFSHTFEEHKQNKNS